MLIGNQSISYYSFGNVTVWLLMSFQAGLINMGGFMAGHHFVSHVTGYATFFGHELTKENVGAAFGMLTIPIVFLLGSMVSGYFVDIRLKLHKKPKYYITFGIIFFLLLIVFIFGATLNYTLLYLLCLICGIQNGTISTVSRSVLRTTHLTGLTTDLGVGFIRLIFLKKLTARIKEERKATLMRLGIIFSFMIGSLLGGFVFKTLGHIGFAIPLAISGTLFVLMLYFQVWKPRRAMSLTDT